MVSHKMFFAAKNCSHYPHFLQSSSDIFNFELSSMLKNFYSRTYFIFKTVSWYNFITFFDTLTHKPAENKHPKISLYRKEPTCISHFNSFSCTSSLKLFIKILSLFIIHITSKTSKLF